MRKVHWGTPARSAGYLWPRRTHALVLGGLGAGAGVLALLLLGDGVGVRSPVSPGHVSSRHMNFDAGCDQCHVVFDGARDVRCQRCHDPASAGRLTNAAHVFFGSLDSARAAAAPHVACATCHVEHRGTEARLTGVDEAHCTGCHGDAARLGASAFSSFGAHVEFQVLAQKRRQKVGIAFSHLTHVTGTDKKIGYVLKDRQLDNPSQTCGECHRLRPGADEFDPIRFADHCSPCHAADLKMEPVNPADVDRFDALELSLDEATLRRWGVRRSDFDEFDGKLQKAVVSHADPWIEHNRLKLWRLLDPAAFAAVRARLVGRQSRLERHLALAKPTAGQDAPALGERVKTLQAEVAYLDERLAAQTTAREPVDGLARLEQALSAATAAGAARAEAEALVRRGAALGARGVPAEPLGAAQFEQRRDELLGVLDAIEKASPARAGQVAELRRRLGQLTAGDTSAALLQRARDQRADTLRRVRDEIELRRSGTAPPSETLMASERQAILAALRAVELRVAELDRIEEPEGMPGAATLERTQRTLAALTKGCARCHEISPLGELPEVHAAEPALWRATFGHRDHLTQGEACASCHAGGEGDARWSVETSRQASDFNFKGVDSCRECHAPGRVSDACQECHDYHPPAKP